MPDPIDTIERLRVALADRYEILSELGRGGMATVYLARDLKHDRQVAVKVLKPELATVVGAGRFLREIRIAAQLSHPHILAVYDSGEADGLLFYAMPFVQGESLRDRLAREGQLGLEDALQITREAGEALGYAHSMGLVHRDIKPENIMLAGGHAVVADFGIARATGEGDTGPKLTETGVAVGTPAYMSPEQWTGVKVDGRADQYSLACTLYEMLVGEPPFTGPNVQIVLARHSMEMVPSVRIARPTVPDAVEAAIMKAMSKVPADRFATIHQLIEALSTAAASRPSTSASPLLTRTGAGIRVQTPPFADTPPTREMPAAPRRRPQRVITLAAIAVVALVGGYLGFRQFAGGDDTSRFRLVVLPFQNLGAADDEYFADGLTEEVISRLATVERIGVIARTSAMQYKGTTKTMRQIGDELRVGYVMEGSIRWDKSTAQGRVKVSSRLIKVNDGTQVWGDEYDVVLAQVFAVQSEIAERVFAAMNVALLEPQRRRMAAQPTKNLEAYDFFLRGNSFYNKSWERADVETAISMYNRAVALDPEFGLAWAHLGRAHAWMHRLGYDPTEARLGLAKAAVDSALRIAPDLPETHVAQALYHYWGRWEYERAIDELGRARELQPGNALVWQNIGNVRRRQGRWTETVEAYQRAGELDPRAHVIWYNIGEAYMQMHQYADAEPYFNRANTIQPDFVDSYVLKAQLAIHRDGDLDAARNAIQDAAERVPPSQWRPAQRGLWLFGFARIAFGTPEAALGRMRPGLYGLDTTAYYSARAELAGRLGQSAAARAYYDSARVLLERRRDVYPESGPTHGELGVAYAGLGRTADALAEARQAVDLLPISKDALDGPDWVVNLARVLLMTGDKAAAIQQLETAVAIPSRVSRNWLRLDPMWTPLRDNPRFQRLVAAPSAN